MAVQTHPPPESLPASISTSRNGPRDPEREVTVLVISPFDDDRAAMQEIFRHSNWKLNCVAHCSEALRMVRSGRVPVIIAERDQHDGCWKELLRDVALCSQTPLPRLIVASTHADDSLWSEALNLGAYNVLAKPFDSREVFWVVSHAWLDWKNEVQRSRSHALRAAAAS